MTMNIHNLKPKHLRNMAFRLVPRYRDGMELAQIAPHIAGSYDRLVIKRWLMDNFTHDQMELVHTELVNEYRKSGGENYFQRGRPFGAKNKSTTSRETHDPMRELYGNYEDAQELESNNSAETNDTDQKLDASKFALKTELKALENTFNEYYKDNFNDVYNRLDTLYMRTDELSKRIDNIVDQRPTIVELSRPDLPNLEMGVQHKNFPTLMKMCSAAMRNKQHLNIWIYGPAGTGKSTAGEKVAEALELDFYTDGKLADAFEVKGYRGSNGEYHTTQFRQAFENGGIYLADEIDGSMPDALLAFNAALANGICAFPDKVVKRHPNFIFLAAANTTGQGGTIEYVGRFKQDAAFLDRFVSLYWPIDEGLEDALCANKDWLARVRQVRQRLLHSSIKGHLITTRAVLYGEALIAAELDQEEVERATLRKGLTDAQWSMIN